MGIFGFPNPVNEHSARLVATGVLVMALMTLAFRQPLFLFPLCYGFVARVLTGPKLSPLGQFVTRVVVPRLGRPPKYVAGPPKRFAQGMGAAITGLAVISHFALGWTEAAYVLTALIVVASTLESVFAICIGCLIFGVLMKWGLIPREVCEKCENIRNSPDFPSVG